MQQFFSLERRDILDEARRKQRSMNGLEFTSMGANSATAYTTAFMKNSGLSSMAVGQHHQRQRAAGVVFHLFLPAILRTRSAPHARCIARSLFSPR